MTRYRIFDVDTNGKYHDTNKFVEVKDDPSTDRYGHITSFGSVAKDLLTQYGFTSHFANYYYPRLIKECDPTKIEITYDYVNDGGVKPTWYLERVEENLP